MRRLLLLACVAALVLPAVAAGGFSDGGDTPADLCPPPGHFTAGDACLPCTVDECREPVGEPNEGGGGGGGYPLFCGAANDFYTYGGPTIYINGPLGWRWRVCTYGGAYVAPGLYTNEYGWIDGCPYPNGAISCWRWRPA